tara:strand:+ start:1119 stop:1676 length:558 start_codon:yes stop_codon:yes gene_type:complete
MIKFFGLLSKKKKIKVKKVASIYVIALNNVINEGFIEIKEFINNNNNLEVKPNLLDNDIIWFRNIIFLGNIHNLHQYFEETEARKLRGYILDELYKNLNQNEQNLAIERFLDYENYFAKLISENEFPTNSMAYAIFEKYKINNYQGDLFKRKNKPNPVFYNELKNLLKHFLWNWEEYLEKNKVIF